MTSRREQALRGLFLCLYHGLFGVRVERNYVVPTSIPREGLVVVRDGNPGEPDIVLSPLHYIYNHRAEVEVFVQDVDDRTRDAALDNLIVHIGDVLHGAETFNGVIDCLRVDSPDLFTQPVEGAAPMKAATLPVTLEYVTTTPLA